MLNVSLSAVFCEIRPFLTAKSLCNTETVIL